MMEKNILDFNESVHTSLFNAAKHIVQGDELDAYVHQWTDITRKTAQRASGYIEVNGNGTIYSGTLVATDDRKAKHSIGADGTKKYQNRYPLSGLLICPYCGSTLKRKQVHNKRIEWWCSKSIKEGVKACKGIHVRDEDAVMQNITEPTVVKEMMINGEKHYSYTRKSEYDSHFEQPKPKKVENGGILQGIHRPRRAVIKL